MILSNLLELIDRYDIPENVILMTDNSSDYNLIDMNGVYYNREKNTIIFTQTYLKDIDGRHYDYFNGLDRYFPLL